MEIHKFTANIVTKENLTEDVMRITFSHPPNFSFKAGQFIQINFGTKEDPTWKAYSILNPPSHNSMIEIIVKIIDGGIASGKFKACYPGDMYEIKGPLGAFTFNEADNNTNIVMLCAGTGVAPFYSMIREYLPKNPNKLFTLLFGVRTKSNLLLVEKFELMQRKHPNFKFEPVLSREEWEGKKGHVQEHLPEQLEDTKFYICGLKELVLETEEILLKRGVSKENIKKERYS